MFLFDQILDSRTKTTHKQQYISYLVGRKGHPRAQAKWMSAKTLKRKFPHLLMEAGTLPDLNREELGKQEGHTPSFSNPDKEESFVKTI